MTALNAQTLPSATPTTHVPGYPRNEVNVGIVHFGVGGFHRAHQAVYLDDLLTLDPAARDFGLCGVSLLPHDRRIVDILTRQDTLYTLLTHHPEGRTDARIIGSIVDHRFAPDDPEGVLALMASPQVRIVTLTITEGGYFYSPGDDTVNFDAPDLGHDVAHPEDPRTAFGYILEALRRRRAAGLSPFTVLSCDNVHANGDVARRVITALAGRVDAEFGAWVGDQVAFPNAMVDRITPQTTPDDLAQAEAMTGLTDDWPVTCESFTQWVIEDRFPQGRPAWENVGAELVDDVRPYELMKMRLLNAGHQTISYFGRLLGYSYGHEAATDPTINRLLRHFQEREAILTLTPIPGTDFDTYSATVRERFANAHIRDSMDRLTGQSSVSIGNYMLPIIRDLLAAGHDTTAAIAVIAIWARFLEGVNEDGQPYTITDPHIDDLLDRGARQPSDLTAAITDNPSFVGLNDNPAFVEPYLATLTSIRDDGLRVTIDALLDRVSATQTVQ